MATIIPLAISNTSPPFQAAVTLDGKPYKLSAMWNFAAQRWYASLVDTQGKLAWYGALVGSPLGYDIPLAPGVFQVSSILFREDSGQFEVSP